MPPEKFVAAIKENDAGFVGLSVLLTTTMLVMKTSIEALKAAPCSFIFKFLYLPL
jgi:methanogenic corrinoid protein MtbC1